MSMTQPEQTAPPTLVTSKGDLRAVLGLALPVLAEQFLAFLVGMTDTWLAGNVLSKEEAVPAMAAVGLMAYTVWMMFVIFSSVGIGATAIVARWFGAGARQDARRATEQSVSLGIFFSIVATLAMWLLADDFVTAMQLQEDAHAMALAYLQILIPAIPGFMMIAVVTACLHGAGDTVTGLLVMALVNVLNVILSPGLALGWGPLPQLGWTGIAIGTSAAHLVGGLLLFGIVLRGRSGLKVRWSGLWPDPSLMRRLLRVGLPGGMNDALVLSCHLWYLGIINSLGTTQAAAHGLAVRIESPGYLSAWAFAVAASALTGQHLGAKNPKRAQRATLVSLSLGAGLLVGYALIVVLAGSWLSDFFLNYPEQGTEPYATGQATQNILGIMASGLPFLAIFSVTSGALRGAGDTTWPLLVTIVGFLLIRMPAAYFLAWEEVPLPFTDSKISGMGWGLTGAWIAMLADVIARTALIVGRYLHGAWKRIEV